MVICRTCLAGAVLLALTGCGQSQDRTTVRAETERFLEAVRTHDGAAACRLLSADTRAELVSQAGRRCVAAVERVKLDGGTVRRVEVDLTNAKLDLSSGESVFLSEEAAGWRIVAVGCRPTHGDPTKEPMDCEVTA